MINLKDKWRELSISKKFTIVFALQNFSLFLAWLFLDANFGALFFLGFFVLFASCVPENDWARDWTKTGYFTFSILVLLFWLLENNMILRTVVDVDYNKLKSYSGFTKDGGSKSGISMKLGVKSDNKYRSFGCSFSGFLFGSSCTEELVSYFGRSNTYGQNMSIKYYNFTAAMTGNVVYEMKHNDKVIYDYNYFVSKYHKQQRNSIIYAVYLIANTLVFCIFYHLIQKNSVQHTQ